MYTHLSGLSVGLGAGADPIGAGTPGAELRLRDWMLVNRYLFSGLPLNLGPVIDGVHTYGWSAALMHNALASLVELGWTDAQIASVERLLTAYAYGAFEHTDVPPSITTPAGPLPGAEPLTPGNPPLVTGGGGVNYSSGGYVAADEPEAPGQPVIRADAAPGNASSASDHPSHWLVLVGLATALLIASRRGARRGGGSQ